MKKRLIASALSVLMTVSLLTGCGGNANDQDSGESTEGKAAESKDESTKADNQEQKSDGKAEAAKLSLWLTEQLHVEFYDEMEKLWNEQNPDKQIELEYTVLPYEDMHSKLLIALQAGTGAPDMADIELGKFSNFLKGDPQLVALNDVIEPYKGDVVQSRLDIYSKDGNYYGLDFHVGASMMYYNTELLEQADVDYTTIKTWDDYHEAGKKVLEKTGMPMTAVDTGDVFSFFPLLSQQGSGLLKEDGTNNVDSPEMVKALTFIQEMLNDGTAVVSPGGSHHSEEYWGFMNGSQAASVSMPMWYMNRFTDHMPDLSGKMVIAPNPVWTEGGDRSVGLGGTGTAVTVQSTHPELAAEFLVYAKLSVEGNIRLYTILGFDPLRPDVWEMDEVRNADTKFEKYFENPPFESLMEVKDEIPAIIVGENFPDVMNAMTTTILYRAFENMEDPAIICKEEAAMLK